MAQHRVSTRRRHRESDVVVLVLLIFIVSFCTKAVYTALGIIYELSKFINQLHLSMWWFVPIVLKSFLKIDNYVVCCVCGKIGVNNSNTSAARGIYKAIATLS